MENRPTWASDLGFEPKVWSDHSKAYFDKKLVLGAFAVRNDDLEKIGTGLTTNFPYYNSIGPAEEPTEDESLQSDNLTDDSFSATVFEVAKSVTFTERSFLASADGPAGMTAEANRQIGRVFAERVEEKLLGEIFQYDGVNTQTPGTDKTKYNNMTIGFTASAAAHTMTAQRFLQAMTLAFGDKKDDVQVCFMHSLQVLDLMQDTNSGFLKADANSPYNMLKGFVGNLFGVPIIQYDGVPKASSQIANTDAYVAHFHKMGSFGIIEKKDVNMVEDYHSRERKYSITANHWYGVKSFDRKIHSLDQKAGGMITTVSHDLERG